MPRLQGCEKCGKSRCVACPQFGVPICHKLGCEINNNLCAERPCPTVRSLVCAVLWQSPTLLLLLHFSSELVSHTWMSTTSQRLAFMASAMSSLRASRVGVRCHGKRLGFTGSCEWISQLRTLKHTGAGIPVPDRPIPVPGRTDGCEKRPEVARPSPSPDCIMGQCSADRSHRGPCTVNVPWTGEVR